MTRWKPTRSATLCIAGLSEAALHVARLPPLRCLLRPEFLNEGVILLPFQPAHCVALQWLKTHRDAFVFNVLVIGHSYLYVRVPRRLPAADDAWRVVGQADGRRELTR